MKKLISLLLTALLCASLASCAKQSLADDTTDKSVTDKITESNDTTAPELPAETKPSVDWKSEAVKILEPLKETNDTYCLYDMNGDDVPELIILTGKNAAQTQYNLYDLTKTDASALAFGSGNSVLGGYEGIAVITLYGKMGEETITKFTYDGTKIDSQVLVTREVPVGEDYTEISEVAFFAANDQNGLAWTKNPSENNADTVKAIS